MTTWTLTFDVAPDATGTPGDTANVRLRNAVPRGGALNTTPLDTFVTLGATPPTYNWLTKTYDVSGWFEPEDSRIAIDRTGGADSVHVRRLRVTSSLGQVLYGAWPDGGEAYTAVHQDGVLGRQYIGQDIGVGSGDVRGEQLSLDSDDYEPPGETLDWYFAPITVAPPVAAGWQTGSIRIGP